MESLSSCGAAFEPFVPEPIEFEQLATGNPGEVTFAEAPADVSYVAVRLSDGTLLTLTPVEVYGVRYVAFATPRNLAVDSATVCLYDGLYFTAVPFNARDGTIDFLTWLRPGERGQARVTKQIASGIADGKPWRVTAYVGPWGTCLDSTFVYGGAACMPAATLPGFLTGSPGPATIFGSAPASVSSVRVRLNTGVVLRVPVVAAGSYKYFAFVLVTGQTMRHFATYDAAGNQLSSFQMQ